MSASRMFLPMNRQIKTIQKLPIHEILQRKGPIRPIEYKSKPEKQYRKKKENVFKSRNELLRALLKNKHGPLDFTNSKFLNAQEKLHRRRKEEANKRHKLIVINAPNRTIFKAKSPVKEKKAKAKSTVKETKAKAKAKSPVKEKKVKCNTPRCKARKMKGNVCDAKIKNGGNFCKRHRKKK